MTRTSSLSIVAAALVAGILASGAVVPVPASAPAASFWQLQGAGPAAGAEPEAMARLRAEARQGAEVVVAAR